MTIGGGLVILGLTEDFVDLSSFAGANERAGLQIVVDMKLVAMQIAHRELPQSPGRIFNRCDDVGTA